ncbi:hypothetical protein [Mycolicibacterium goodii]
MTNNIANNLDWILMRDSTRRRGIRECVADSVDNVGSEVVVIGKED